MSEHTQTDYTEFLIFDKMLRSNAPKGYIPHYISIKKGDKNPDWLSITSRAGQLCSQCKKPWSIIIERDIDGNDKKKRRCPDCGSKPSNWKLPHAKLNTAECVLRLQRGDNIGLAALKTDDLIILDGDETTSYDELKTLNTLLDRSRKRIGGHAFCFDATPEKIFKKTIPTSNDVGEIRSKDAYVVIAGSFVPTDSTEYKAGLYTVENCASPKHLTSFDELPEIYKHEYTKNKDVVLNTTSVKSKFTRIGSLFDLDFNDVLPLVKFHTSHPEHGSDTGTNFSISNDRKTCTCWRHNVSFGVVQYLAMAHGEFSCQEVGKQHNTHTKSSADWDKLITCAYLQAVKLSLISPNDKPIEVSKYMKKVRV